MKNDAIIGQFAFQRQYLSLLVDDIPAERMTAQVGGLVNHPAWQLGHLAVVADSFRTLLGGAPTLEAWTPLFGQGSVPRDDLAAYPAKDELIRVLDEKRTAWVNALKNATPEDLAKPNPFARVAAMLPTVGNMMLLGLVSHESTHLGQLASWRRAAGMCEALSKMGR